MEIASFEKFLVDKIKVQGKTGEHLLLPSLGLVCAVLPRAMLLLYALHVYAALRFSAARVKSLSGG